MPIIACSRCGYEDKLHRGRLCSRCTLADRLSDLLDDGSNQIRPELAPLAGPLLSMDRPRSGLSWLSGRKGQDGSPEDLLRRIGRGEIELTHEAFQRIENWRAAAHLREPLMACGILPVIDKQVWPFERWLPRPPRWHPRQGPCPARPPVRHLGCPAVAPRPRGAEAAHPRQPQLTPDARSSRPLPSFSGSPGEAASWPAAAMPTSTPGTPRITSTPAGLSGSSFCGPWPTSSPVVSSCPLP